ncbi:hypothetical protein ACFL9U_17135 [Thermodesulfobacteriota bacterium]
MSDLKDKLKETLREHSDGGGKSDSKVSRIITGNNNIQAVGDININKRKSSA